MAAMNYAFIYDEDGFDNGSDPDVDRGPDDDKNEDKEEQEKSDIRVRHTEARSGSVMTIIFISVIAAAVLGLVIYSLDKRNTMYNKVSAKNHELSLVEADNVRLQSELESSISAKNVEDYAKNVLKMQKIDSSQITYIKVQQGDVVNRPEKEKGIKAKIQPFFEDLVEYFRG